MHRTAGRQRHLTVHVLADGYTGVSIYDMDNFDSEFTKFQFLAFSI